MNPMDKYTTHLLMDNTATVTLCGLDRDQGRRVTTLHYLGTLTHIDSYYICCAECEQDPRVALFQLSETNL